MTRYLCVGCVIGCLLLLAGHVLAEAVAPGASGPAREELFRKELGKGQAIVVTRQEIGADQWRLLGAGGEAPKRVYSVCVALHGDGPPVVLACRVVRETDWLNTGFVVVGMVADAGELILAVGRGAELALWDIRFGMVSTDSWTPLHGWYFTALARTITPETQKMEFGRLPDGRWSVSVTELRGGKPLTSPTEYQQEKEMGWRLTRRGELLGTQR